MQKQLHSVSQIIHIENKDLLNFIDNASIPDAAGFMEQLDVVDNAACSWKSLMSGISMNVFQGFRNEEELVDYAMHRAYADNVTVFASKYSFSFSGKIASLRASSRVQSNAGASWGINRKPSFLTLYCLSKLS